MNRKLTLTPASTGLTQLTPAFSCCSLVSVMTAFLSLGTSSPMGQWILMEVSSVAFLGMLCHSARGGSALSSASYFLPAAFSGVALQFVILSWESLGGKEWLGWFHILLVAVLSAKMGLPPFCFWVPPVVKNLSWGVMFFFTTFQKLPAIVFWSFFGAQESSLWDYYFFFSISFSLLSSILAYHHLGNLQTLFAFSSMNSVGFMLVLMLFKSQLSLSCILGYFLCVGLFCLSMAKGTKMSSCYFLVVLSGFPLTPPFLMKWVCLDFLVQFNLMGVAFMAVTSLIILFPIFLEMGVIILWGHQRWEEDSSLI